MRPIPFYSDEEPQPLAWQRPALSNSSETDKRYDTLLDAFAAHARRGYWASRWMLRHPAASADLVRAQLRLALIRERGEVIELDGIKLRVRTEYSPRLARELLARTYAASERQLLRQAIEDDDMVMEVGTGIGVLATLCACRLGSDRVTTYDAHPAMVRAARETFALNGVLPRLAHCALGRTAGMRSLYAGDTLGDGGPGRDARRMSVPGATLAEAIGRDRPTLLIIDVEGGECELVKDAIGLRVPKILIAFNPQLIGTLTVLRARLAFAQAGYVVSGQSTDGNRVLYRRADIEAPTLTDEHAPGA